MKTSFKISVVVPIYNTEKYLEACLNSLRNQTFCDYEVWLIDDGSTDRSGKICDTFVEKDNRFHVIHKSNGGVSSARNLGLEHATGKWICFVDADDAVEKNHLDNLYAATIGEEIDEMLVVQGFKMIQPGKTPVLRLFERKRYEKEEMYCVFQDLNLNRSGFPFAKLYNNRIIQEKNIRFSEAIHYAEDVMFMLAYMCHITVLKTIPDTTYNYFIHLNANSLSTRINSFESEYTCYQTYLSTIQELKKRFDIQEKALVNTYGVISEYLVRRSIGSLYQKRTRKLMPERIAILKSLTKEQIAFLNKYYIHCSWFHKMTTFLLTKRYYYLCDLFNQLIAIGRSLKMNKACR